MQTVELSPLVPPMEISVRFYGPWLTTRREQDQRD
jgi:hypothetical protein